MREDIFMHAPGPSSGSGPPTVASPRQVVAWHRVKDFQLLSLRLICSKILHTTPYYLNIADTAMGRVKGASRSRRKLSISGLSPRTRQTLMNTATFRVADLDGLFVPEEAQP